VASRVVPSSVELITIQWRFFGDLTTLPCASGTVSDLLRYTIVTIRILHTDGYFLITVPVLCCYVGQLFSLTTSHSN
jgi:hypothetical protein